MEKKLVEITVYLDDKYYGKNFVWVNYEIKNNKFYVLGFTENCNLCNYGNSIIKNDIIGKSAEIEIGEINNVTMVRNYKIKNEVKITNEIMVKYCLSSYNDFFKKIS